MVAMSPASRGLTALAAAGLGGQVVALVVQLPDADAGALPFAALFGGLAAAIAVGLAWRARGGDRDRHGWRRAVVPAAVVYELAYLGGHADAHPALVALGAATLAAAGGAFALDRRAGSALALPRSDGGRA